jgi:hypothetical protein
LIWYYNVLASARVRWEGHIARIRKNRNAYRAGNRIRISGSVARNFDHWKTEAVWVDEERLNKYMDN